MRFGPEVDNALGGRLEGEARTIPPQCAAILRALLINRAPARINLVSLLTYAAGGDSYELKFHTSPAEDLDRHLEAYKQEGFLEEKDLTRAVSGKNARAHMLRHGDNACAALIQTTSANQFRKRVFKTVAFLPRLLPGIFAEKPLSEAETALLAAAFEVKCEAVEEILEKLYKETDLSIERNKQAIRGLVTHRLQTGLRRARDEMVNAEQSANSHMAHYMAQSQLALERRLAAEGLERRIESMSRDVEDILAYLKTLKTVSVNVEGNTLVLDVTAPLKNFDPDAYRVIRDKDHAHFRSNIAGDHGDALLFFDALFLEELIKINAGARYHIDPSYGVTGGRRTWMPAAVPNPHIQYHSCLGQYRGDMQEALAKSDFIGVIDFCISSAVSLNIPESPTCGEFIKDVTRGSHKAVLLPGGEAVSYKQAVAWLKARPLDTLQKGVAPEGSELDGYSDDNETEQEEELFF